MDATYPCIIAVDPEVVIAELNYVLGS